MKFKSTRGKVTGFSFEDAVCSGYASDGGLFVPETLPTLAPATVRALARMTRFEDVAFVVLRLFISVEEMPDVDLKTLLHDAFVTFPVTNPNNTNAYDNANNNVLPTRTLADGTVIGELFHGPTLSFKDFGQQMLIRLVDYFTTRASLRRCLVVATTGDTGPAALYAVAACRSLDIVCGFPRGQVSRLQELQMTTVDSDNVSVFAFEGGGDDMDPSIKAVTTSPFAAERKLCGVNSINLARVTTQVAHYVWLYTRLAFPNVDDRTDTTTDATEGKTEDAPLPVVIINVPTGAMGNVMSGYFARLVGLPLALSCSVNANNMLHKAVTTGVFSAREPLRRTLSEAMNVQCPYNFERMLYYLCGQDCDAVSTFYTTLGMEGSVTLSDTVKTEIAKLIRTTWVTDAEMAVTVRSIALTNSSVDSDVGVAGVDAAAIATIAAAAAEEEKTGTKGPLTIIDPHTAVAVTGTRKLGLRALPAATVAALKASGGLWPLTDDSDGSADAAAAGGVNPPVVVLATAHPAKFAEATTAALGTDAWNALFFNSETRATGPLMPARAAALYSKEIAQKAVFAQGEDWEEKLRVLIDETIARSNSKN